MDKCEHDHTIPSGEGLCAEGHPRISFAIATDPMQRMMAMMEAQQNQLREQQEQMNNAMKELMASNERERKLREALENALTVPSSTVKPTRPTVAADATDSDWELFLDAWERYKQMANLRNPMQLRNELRMTCSDEVNRRLINIVTRPVLESISETDLLMHIKKVAVIEIHKEVHRQAFNKLDQAEGESITQFVSKLKEKSHHCDFVVTCKNTACNAEVSFADEMVTYQMIAGLHNQDHQMRVLAEAEQLKTFKEKFDKLISLETTESATPLLSGQKPSSVNASKSEYRAQKEAGKRNMTRDDSERTKTKCKGCGHPDHLGKPMDMLNCPARNVVCHKCKKKGHYPRMCNVKRTDSKAHALSVADDADDTSKASAATTTQVATIF